MKLLQILLIIVCFITNIVFSQNELPIQSANSTLKPLGSLFNQGFQKELELQLNKNQKWKNLIQQNKMAVGVIDLSDPNNIKYARINGNHMMYAASLPKIAILLAAMDAIEKGELIETPEVTNDMKIMISKSNNAAATKMIDLVGFDKIESVLTDAQYHLYDEEHGGGLWVGKRYASTGATNREPLQHLSHAATVNQVCRFYYLLANGKLVSKDRSKQMLEIMKDPALHHKFVNTLDEVAPEATLYRKSGSWKNYHSDSVLVWGKNPKRRYILVALIEDPNGENIIRNLVKPVEKALKIN
jgi:beta-lactamase class A